MRRETRFDPAAELIVVDAIVAGPRRRMPVRLVVDTGSAMTTVIPDVLDELGYSARDGLVRTSVQSAVGRETGYVLRVSSLTALGFTLADYPVHVFDLAEAHHFDGLIGLDLLARFNYEVRSAEGRIFVEPAGQLTTP